MCLLRVAVRKNEPKYILMPLMVWYVLMPIPTYEQ